MTGRFTTLDALRAIAEGRHVPHHKFAALQRRALIRWRGKGGTYRVCSSEAGEAFLAEHLEA